MAKFNIKFRLNFCYEGILDDTHDYMKNIEAEDLEALLELLLDSDNWIEDIPFECYSEDKNDIDPHVDYVAIWDESGELVWEDYRK